MTNFISSFSNNPSTIPVQYSTVAARKKSTVKRVHATYIDSVENPSSTSQFKRKRSDANTEKKINPRVKPDCDPTFLKKFGINTSVRYTNEIVVDPTCKKYVDQCWRTYQKKWEANTEQAKEEALLFSDCIDHTSSTGVDKWANRYEVKWVNESVGYGLFAKEDYCKGDVVGFYSGYLTKSESVQDKDYAFDLFESAFAGLSTDGAQMSNATRYINHASDKRANVETVTFIYNSLPYVMFVVKSFFIPAGKELLYDYGTGYWENKGIEPVDL